MDLVRGIDFHTFSIMGRCRRTGALGVGITTRSMAVASRCPYVAANIGAVATQASTDPRLGRLALRLLEQGFSAPKVLEEVAASDPYIEHRQIGIVDRDGNSAARTGSENKDWAGTHHGPRLRGDGQRTPRPARGGGHRPRIRGVRGVRC